MTVSSVGRGRLSGLRVFFRGGRAAVVLLTRIPLATPMYSTAEWEWAAGWFPVVGAGIGTLVAGVWWLAQPLGNWPAVLLAIAMSTMLTGALHEDGLADTADALGGAHDRSTIFEILKDSRVGTYGALALIMSILLRASLLVGLDRDAPVALVLSHAVARLFPGWMMALVPYVTPGHLAKSTSVARIGRWSPWIATGATAAIIAVLSASGLVSLAASFTAVVVAAAVAAVLTRYFVFRAGGVTGDFLGAVEQTSECAVLVVLLGAHGPSTCC